MAVKEIKAQAPESDLYKIESGTYVLVIDERLVSAKQAWALAEWIETSTGSKVAIMKIADPQAIKAHRT